MCVVKLILVSLASCWRWPKRTWRGRWYAVRIYVGTYRQFEPLLCDKRGLCLESFLRGGGVWFCPGAAGEKEGNRVLLLPPDALPSPEIQAIAYIPPLRSTLPTPVLTHQGNLVITFIPTSTTQAQWGRLWAGYCANGFLVYLPSRIPSFILGW